MNVLNNHSHFVKITLIEVIRAVWIHTFYFLLFLLLLGHCCQDLLETVEDESVFMVRGLAVLMDKCVSDPNLSAKTDKVYQHLSS